MPNSSNISVNSAAPGSPLTIRAFSPLISEKSGTGSRGVIGTNGSSKNEQQSIFTQKVYIPNGASAKEKRIHQFL